MQVESYESVHQLVTTVLGSKDPSVSSVQALQRCFPPGSMTGAPKVRSVEILQKLEQRPRGVYSGVIGWIGLDGAASTSVVIRTVVINGQDVSVGGGGAITYLSDAEKEWQEVIDKVQSIATLQQSNVGTSGETYIKNGQQRDVQLCLMEKVQPKPSMQ